MGVEAKGADQSFRNQVRRSQVVGLWLKTTFSLVPDRYSPTLDAPDRANSPDTSTLLLKHTSSPPLLSLPQEPFPDSPPQTPGLPQPQCSCLSQHRPDCSLQADSPSKGSGTRDVG